MNWSDQCTRLMAADQYLIVLARSCIGSFRGGLGIESQAIQSIEAACGVHGLSAQIGAVRGSCSANAGEMSAEKHIFRCAVTRATKD